MREEHSVVEIEQAVIAQVGADAALRVMTNRARHNLDDTAPSVREAKYDRRSVHNAATDVDEVHRVIQQRIAAATPSSVIKAEIEAFELKGFSGAWGTVRWLYLASERAPSRGCHRQMQNSSVFAQLELPVALLCSHMRQKLVPNRVVAVGAATLDFRNYRAVLGSLADETGLHCKGCGMRDMLAGTSRVAARACLTMPSAVALEDNDRTFS